MRFGFHVSIANGLARAVSEARARRCQTIQIFSRNPRGWQAKDLDPDDVAEFRAGIRAAGIVPVAVHMPYLVNLAADSRPAFRRSVASLALELTRVHQLGANYVVMHMGKCGTATEAEALERMIEGIDQAFHSAPCEVQNASCPTLLLENTAGMGHETGYRFEHLKTVIEGIRERGRIGVVLDTAHLFEAGYELRNRAGVDQTLREFDSTVGLKRLYLLHLNDSKTDFGSRVDRHDHIGKGKIGKQGFRHIVNHPLLRHLPGIMETPRTGIREDRMNMRAVKALVARE